MSQFDFKIAVFDLDFTLHDGINLYRNVLDILRSLKSNGIILYIASFNRNARQICEKLNISEYFTDIYYGRERSKSDMLTDILFKNRHMEHSKYEVVFFDDDFENILDVRKRINVRTAHIGIKGISWKHIPVKFSYNSEFDLESKYNIAYSKNVNFYNI